MVRNAAAAIALVLGIYGDTYGDFSPALIDSVRAALKSFHGTRRRSEIIGEARGVLVIDDYAHHPTALQSTIEGFRSFYPGRRLVLSFMSHTYSRTASLLENFAKACASADLVILHEIYASAREKPIPGLDGSSLAELTKALNSETHYFPKHEESIEQVLGLLKEGDLFITMGAGDNWKLGKSVLKRLESQP